MNSRHPILRGLFFSLEILLLWLLQSTPRLLPELFGAKPVLLLAAALSFSVCTAPAPAAVWGAVCGVAADIASGGTVGYFAIVFTLVCFAQASVLGTYFNRNWFTAVVLSVGSVVAVLGVYWALTALFRGVPDGGVLFVRHYLPRMAYTAAAFVPLYLLNRFLTGKF